jgi:signal transduction histidine kinase
MVGRIGNSTARMMRMVGQLLDLTRARIAGGIPIEAKPDTDLSTIVRGVVEELRAAHPHAEIVVCDDGPAMGRWDPDRLGQVVSNILANAIVHGDGPVYVRVCRAPASALLEVRNQGQPIPDDLLPRIFEAFRGTVPGRAKGRSGLGLGLFIADRIVAAHGGRIDAHSTAVAGTTFTVHLPIAVQVVTRGAGSLSSVEHAESPRPSLH